MSCLRIQHTSISTMLSYGEFFLTQSRATISSPLLSGWRGTLIRSFFVMTSSDYKNSAEKFRSDRWSSRRHRDCLFILEWHAPRNPKSRSPIILQLQICPQTRRVSRQQLENARKRSIALFFSFQSMCSFWYNASVTVVHQLNKFRAPGSEEWELFRAIKVNMYSSRESKTAWVFCRWDIISPNTVCLNEILDTDLSVQTEEQEREERARSRRMSPLVMSEGVQVAALLIGRR